MSNILNKAMELAGEGKFVYILDTQNELHPDDVDKAIGHGKYTLMHMSTFEQVKYLLHQLVKGIPAVYRCTGAVVIGYLDCLVSEWTLQTIQTGSMPTAEVELPPEEPGESPETVEVSAEMDETVLRRKKLADLRSKIAEVRNSGLQVEVIESERKPV